MSRKNETITLSLSPKHKAILEQKAIAAGYTWGEGKPNVSAWLRAIAENESPEPATRKSDENFKDQIDKAKKALARATAAVNALNN